MPFIAFLGCDGSGKSAVIAAVADRAHARYHTVATGHWQPQPFGRPSSPTSSSAMDPHGSPPRGGLASLAKLGWMAISWWTAWLGGLGRCASSGILLFDRYYGDLLVDPVRYRFGGSLSLARIFFRFLPKPDLIIFLDAAPEVLLERKQEVPLEALHRSRTRYLELCSQNIRCTVVDASAPLATVIAEVEKRIANLPHKREHD